MFNDVHGAPGRTARRGRRPYRPGVNGQPQTWKACWGQPLASSNLASSATLTGTYAESGHNGHQPGSPVVSVLSQLALRTSLLRPHLSRTGGARPARRARTRGAAAAIVVPGPGLASRRRCRTGPLSPPRAPDPVGGRLLAPASPPRRGR